MDDSEWLPDEAIRSLQMERSVEPSETEEQLARRMLREATPVAAASIIHLAVHGGTERTRLDASKYVLERTMGRIGETFEGDEDPWTKLFKDIMRNSPPDASQLAPTTPPPLSEPVDPSAPTKRANNFDHDDPNFDGEPDAPPEEDA
jgi:hypothetical protein